MNPGLELIKEFESCRLKAYLDGGGVPTIGWGHTKSVKMGDTCTQERADEWLDDDTTEARRTIARRVACKLNDNQYGALLCFIFNIGDDQFRTSTMLRKLNISDYAGAATQFPRWNMDNGVVVPGLTRRRKAERDLFERAPQGSV